MAYTGSVGDRFDNISNGPASSGEENVDRMVLNSQSNAPATGAMRFSHFTSRRTEDITRIRVWTGSTAAGATPTLAQLAVYSEDPATGNLTLVANTANDTTLFAAASTSYTRSFTASWKKRAGTRYAISTLVVSAAAMPSFLSVTVQNQTECAVYPRRTGTISGQASLPASVTAGSLLNSGMFIYAVLLP